MLIWHVNADAVPQNVNGVNTTIWTVAEAQASAGHEVVLLLFDPPSAAALRFAEEAKITLLHVPSNRFWVDAAALRQAMRRRPQIVHMHSVFIPRQVGIARALVRSGIPYVVTPAGGVSPHVLERGRAKKWLYGRLFERPRFRAAAAVTAVMRGELDEIRAFLAGAPVRTSVIANPVDARTLKAKRWQPSHGGVPRLVYLGRADIQHKGLDRLVDIARRLPDVEFDLYVPQQRSSATALARLLPPRNVTLHAPVYGDDKLEVLANATAYIQTSRWEAFGVSVAEAMSLGVPCAVTDSMNIAGLIGEADAGLVLPQEAGEAASALRAWLRYPETLAAHGRRARELAAVQFASSAVSEAYLRLYGEIIGHGTS